MTEQKNSSAPSPKGAVTRRLTLSLAAAVAAFGVAMGKSVSSAHGEIISQKVPSASKSAPKTKPPVQRKSSVDYFLKIDGVKDEKRRSKNP
jgi:hypothetical protein